ncbi:aldehyde dehydrogenase family protein [uncultured Bradyrhizobium sp.]|uniref:aldehyde dehydrogenase family protein n=1 Tax=uncultured Bradyrhizobium sp. TaxID=199684 RepID=UPI0035C994C4
MNISVAAVRNNHEPHLARAASVERLLEFLRGRRQDVLEILTDVASYSAADAELAASIKALEGAVLEIDARQPRTVGQMSVFMPSNIVLYSYVLYLVIPSLFVRRIDFRPSSYVIEQTARLHAMLGPVHGLPLHIRCVSQRTFMEDSVRPANIVVFTGTYANAEKIKLQLRKDQLYVFFGQGVNPFIVSESADIDSAVRDLVAVRMFNSGQDCMGPDAVFVHRSVAERFLGLLSARLKDLVFGSCKDPEADYCPIYYPSTLESLSKYFMSNAQFIYTGGIVDYSRKKIEPTVLYGSLKQKPEIVEFFGPVFNVIRYDTNDALIGELAKDFYKDRAMGASVYGNRSLADYLRTHHSVSVDATLFDIEDGNSPFGGYGPMANYAQYQGRMKIAPLLISQVVSDLM